MFRQREWTQMILPWTSQTMNSIKRIVSEAGKRLVMVEGSSAGSKTIPDRMTIGCNLKVVLD